MNPHASASAWRLPRRRTEIVASPILILGTSARAAAFSALRGGYKPICADFFGDQDLAAVCHAHRIDPRKSDTQFAAFAGSYRSLPWIYTGGFENRPDLVDRLSKNHRLWGTDGETLRAVRDPFHVACVLEKEGIPVPALARSARGLARDGSWLVKPLKSGGGTGIAPLIDSSPVGLGSHYLQQRIPGPSFSALYIGAPPSARLIGITRQIIGTPRHPFGYRGNIGPLQPAASLAARLEALGSALISTFRLKGWFGVDFVLNRRVPWPVEINPRYTASVEIHELDSGRSLFVEHKRACEGIVDEDKTRRASPGPKQGCFGKLIVYAPRRFVAPECLRLPIHGGAFTAQNTIADVPRPGTVVDAGSPIMTLLVSAPTPKACRTKLLRLERNWLCQMRLVPVKLSCDAP